MSKTFIVARREFLSRVQKKTFLLTTILVPLFIIGLYVAGIYFSIGGNDSMQLTLADPANHLNYDTTVTTSGFKLNVQPGADVANLDEALQKEKIDGYIFVPEEFDFSETYPIIIKARKAIAFTTKDAINRTIQKQLEPKKLERLNVAPEVYEQIRKNAKIEYVTVTAGDNGKSGAPNTGLSYGLGYGTGLLIYFVLFIYGSMVMRGVMEEKVNRIAEVMVSSIRPYQLMMGKIIGIGLVGLVQFLIWAVLITVLMLVTGSFLGAGSAEAIAESAQAASQVQKYEEIMGVIGQINVPLIFTSFVIYFLGGYLMYSSLFAAVGCAVNEDPQDAQSLMMPITIPIIFSIIILNKAVSDPYSTISVFGSMFPLTSPIVMMGRIAHGIPLGVTWWELITSMVLLIAGFLLTTWLSAKIYRTGILMYGKKVTWKEMLKWAFRK